MTGTRHFATVHTLEKAVGWPGATQGIAVFLETILPGMRALGANAHEAGPLSGPVEGVLTALLKSNPETVAPFSVTWNGVGHTMVAYLSLFGELRILDRTGKIFSTLVDVEQAGHSGISQAVFYARSDTALLVAHATIVPTLQNGAALSSLIQAGATPLRGPDGTLTTDIGWIRHAIGLEVRSVPFRVETRQSINVPLRVAHAKGQVKTQTFCVPLLQNSDSPPGAPTQDCSTLRTYLVEPGDTLAAIAQTAYGDPQRWRGIAVVNGIKDPGVIQPGTTLLIP